MKIILRPLCVSSCSTLSLLLFSSRVVADFTTTNWNPVRGTKFTIAWSGTSDAGLKNLTLNDADSSGNEFAVVEDIATGINGGSFTWLPSTSIPDGTYVINLYETPNRVNTNGLTFIGKLFVLGDANANQIVASESETTSAVKQVVQTTTSASTTTSQQQKVTVVLPASTTDAVTSTAAISTRAETRASESTEIVSAASTSGGSSSESPQASTISSILSTLKTISTYSPTSTPTSTSIFISLSTSTSLTTISTILSASASSDFPQSTPTNYPIPPTTAPSSSSPAPLKYPQSAILLSLICLPPLFLIPTYLFHRHRKLKNLKSKSNGSKFEDTNNGNRWYKGNRAITGEQLSTRNALYKRDKWYKWNKGKGEDRDDVDEKMHYDGQKRGWVTRVNSRPVELLSNGKM
ncbi:hypothetical protein EAF00_006490 [Botryotinia globosa]|nr:hypothetical protein EAF00_006490 [Botryotinia globosa]